MMEKICKNCGSVVYEGKSYCSNCGAKWIENRITLRNVAHDFADMYIGLDTRFVRTFKDLLIRPQDVINGYINGRRMYYIDAIRYMLLAVFVTGISVFVLLNSDGFDAFIDQQVQQSIQPGMDENIASKLKEFNKKMYRTIFNYQGFMLILTIPLLAFIGRITFWGKRYYNYTEQIVFYMYTYAQYVLFSTPITLIFLMISVEAFFLVSPFTFLIIIGYNAYCYKKIFKLNIGELILKTLIAMIITIIVLVIISLLFVIIGAIIGYFFKDELRTVITG